MGMISRLRSFFHNEFDIADIVQSIQEHPDLSSGLVAILNLPDEQKYAALRTIIQRSEESGAPKRLITCLVMLKDPKLCKDVLIQLNKE